MVLGTCKLQAQVSSHRVILTGTGQRGTGQTLMGLLGATQHSNIGFWGPANVRGICDTLTTPFEKLLKAS